MAHGMKTYKDWLLKYYPIPAYNYKPEIENSEVSTIEHSLREWIGLKKVNLDIYGLFHFMGDLWVKENGGYILTVAGSSCSLCQKYWKSSGEHPDKCHDCPIFKYEGHECYNSKEQHRFDVVVSSAFDIFIDNNNPVPMIKLLIRTIRTAKAIQKMNDDFMLSHKIMMKERHPEV